CLGQVGTARRARLCPPYVAADQSSILEHPASTGALLEVVTEKAIDLRHRHGVREGIEAAFGRDLSRGSHEGTPGNARERAADTDTTHTEARKISDGEAGRRRHQYVHGLRGD